MSTRVTMVRLVHGVIFPEIDRCDIASCYLGRVLRGLRLEPGSHLRLAVQTSAKHAEIFRMPEADQKRLLMEALGAEGLNVVQFNASGVIVVSPRQD